MESLGRAYSGTRTFVTGHTGFKGSWLCEWLLAMGAKVTGFAMEPPTDPALFNRLGLGPRLQDLRGDVRDAAALEAAIQAAQPDVIFHLAAQSLVRRSYAVPLDTFATNAMGTANLLSSLRVLKKPCAVVVVTTDKCYQNLEQGRHYAESDALGGHDPYSGSKAAAEIVTGSWRDSFYAPQRILEGAVPPVAIATARAGNVIGGGDWASERILPDCWRSLSRGEPIRCATRQRCAPGSMFWSRWAAICGWLRNFAELFLSVRLV
jgi:CDP-glucose 4,6-dehydratase